MSPHPSPRVATLSNAAANADERDAVLRLKIGDDATARDAFAIVFQCCYAPAVRFVQRYVGAREAAEDLVQDTFVRLWERRSTIDPDRPVRAFIFAAARNRALNALQHDAVVRAHVAQTHARLATPLDQPAAPAADASLLADELARVVAAQVGNLTPRQREIYQLSREDGLSPGEIAEVLAIAPATVYVQLARIVHALFPALKDWMNAP